MPSPTFQLDLGPGYFTNGFGLKGAMENRQVKENKIVVNSSEHRLTKKEAAILFIYQLAKQR